MPQSERWGIQPYVRGQPKGHKVTCGPGELEGEMAPCIRVFLAKWVTSASRVRVTWNLW